jgi:hypothetical protein
MNDINELVDLPDPATHPLVHPLDLPQARGPSPSPGWSARSPAHRWPPWPR